MEFDIEKFIMLVMYKRKTEATEGTELLNQKIIRTLNEKENDKISNNCGNRYHQAEENEKISKEYCRRRKMLETVVSDKNLKK